MSVAPIQQVGPVGLAPIRAFSPVGGTNAAVGIAPTQPGANARVSTGFDASGDGAEGASAPMRSPSPDMAPPPLFAPVQQAAAVALRRIETAYGDPVSGGSSESPIVAALAQVATSRLDAATVGPRPDTTPGMVARAYSAFAGA